MKYSNERDVLNKVQETVEFLGVRLDSVNKSGIFGNSPLAVAVSWGDADAIYCLLQGGADVNASNENGDTALYRAVRFNYLNIVEALLSFGADPIKRNNEGQNAIDAANELGRIDIANLLSTN